ncbi:MAG: alpha/beta fold hydrolase [Magnetovibrionaceae bacterium]
MEAATEETKSLLAQVSDREAFTEALDREALRQVSQFLDGVLLYQSAKRIRSRAQAPDLAWQEGTSRLWDYGNLKSGPKSRRDRPSGRAIILIPSLINRAYILDLHRRRSLARYLTSKGFRIFLMDWDRPGKTEADFGLTDYIDGRLQSAFEAVRRISGDSKPGVIGYCMGGLLALALATARPGDVGALALLATPWDFAADADQRRRHLSALMPSLDRLTDALGLLPVEVLQSLFASLDPFYAVRKFQAFARARPTSRGTKEFLALEDWLNDGVPLSRPVMRECFHGWYLDNDPLRLNWKVAGQTVDPARYTGPSLVLVPDADRIVCPASALALGPKLPNGRMRTVRAGHIGMIAGSGAGRRVYAPLARWLKTTLSAH